jgi:leucyl aminopeptidase (aminopeptidase T)
MFDVSGRTPTISSGVLTPAQASQGGAALFTWLPAGEFQLAAVPGSAEGKIVIDKALVRGKVIRGLTLLFSQGKLTSMTATSGLEPLKVAYDAAGSGKDRFGLIDIGLNPEVALPLATGAIVWPEAGAVTIGFGNDLLAGGDNNADFGFAGQLGGATITVAGTAVVEKGRLK